MSDDSDEDIWDYKSLKRTRKVASSQVCKKTKKSTTRQRQQLNQRNCFSQQVGNKSTARSKKLKKQKFAELLKSQQGNHDEKFMKRKFSQFQQSEDESNDSDFLAGTQQFSLSSQQCSSSTFQKPKPVAVKGPIPTPSPCPSESGSDLPEIIFLPDQKKKVITQKATVKPKKISQLSPSAIPKTKKKERGHCSSAKNGSSLKSPAAAISTPRKTYDGNCPNCQMPFNSSWLSGGNPSGHVYECMDKPFTAEEECPDGLKCKSVFERHYKKFTHLLLAGYRAGVQPSEEEHGNGHGPPDCQSQPLEQGQCLSDDSERPTCIATSNQISSNKPSRSSKVSSRQPRELDFAGDETSQHQTGGMKAKREDSDEDSKDMWPLPLSQENVARFMEQKTRFGATSNDDVEEGRSTEGDANIWQQADEGGPGDEDEEGFASDEDIFAYPDEEQENDCQDEQMDEGDDEDYGTPPSQSLLADAGLNPIGLLLSEEVPTNDVIDNEDHDRVPLGVGQDGAGAVDRDSGCGTTHVSPAASVVSSPKYEACGCVRIRENVDLCVHQCSQIQVNIRLKPCQSSMCAINKNNNQECRPSVSTTIVDADQGCRPSVSTFHEAQRELEHQEDNYLPDKDDDDEGKLFSKGNQEEFDDEDWPEEEALLASLATDGYLVGSETDVADAETEEQLDNDDDDDIAATPRPDLCRPSYQKIKSEKVTLSAPNVKAETDLGETQDSDIVELEISQKTDTPIEIDLEASQDSSNNAAMLLQNSQNSSSTFGKLLAPVAHTLAKTKSKTQTSLVSFFGWGSSNTSTQKSNAAKDIKTESQNTIKRGGGGGAGGAGGGSGWLSSFRNRGGVVDRKHEPSSSTDSNRDCAISSDQAGIETKYGRGKKPCPFYKKMPGTPFTVDAFRYGNIPDCKAYFLSHFHYDHYGGLTRHFTQPIYCSKVTGNLVKAKLKVPAKYVYVLPMNTPCQIEGVEVTLLEANHCPGAVLFLFKLPDGRTYLHTGDFRANTAMQEYPELQACRIHQLYLDTTYCNPEYNFPTQKEVTEYAASVAVQAVETNPKTLIVCGTYTIGKEKVFMAIADALNCRVCVVRDKKNILDCLEDPLINAKTTLNTSLSRLHVVTMATISHQKLKDYLKKYSGRYDNILAFKPTGWTHSKTVTHLSNTKPSKSGVSTIYGIPYSEHSSFSELRQFVRFLRPDKILATVNNGNPKSRSAMDGYFQSWLSQTCTPPPSPSTSSTGHQNGKRKRAPPGNSPQSSRLERWMKR